MKKQNLENFFLSFCLVLISGSVSAKIIERITAVVDDQMISLNHLQMYRKLLSSSVPYSSELFKIRSRKSLIKSQKKLLNHLIDEKVLQSSLPMNQLNLPKKEDLFKRFLKKSNFSRKSLNRKLRRIGISFEDYQEIIYWSQAYQMWINMEIASSIQITNQDVNDYYLEKRGKNFFTQYKYEFHQWKFELSQKGKKEAEEFLENATRKKPEIKILTEAQMNRSLKKTIPHLSSGQFSKPICFASHCYVFKLVGKSFLVSDNKRTEVIRNKLFKQAFLVRFKNLMQDKRQASIIKKYL